MCSSSAWILLFILHVCVRLLQERRKHGCHHAIVSSKVSSYLSILPGMQTCFNSTILSGIARGFLQQIECTLYAYCCCIEYCFLLEIKIIYTRDQEKIVCCASKTGFTSVIIIIWLNTVQLNYDMMWISSRGVACMILESVTVLRSRWRPQNMLVPNRVLKINTIMLSLLGFIHLTCFLRCRRQHSVKIRKPAVNDL